MNARTVTLAAASFEPVTYSEWSHTETEETIADKFGLYTIEDRDPHTIAEIYRTVGGRNVLQFTIPLNVPICKGCDQVIVDHICDDCELVFLGEVE